MQTVAYGVVAQLLLAWLKRLRVYFWKAVFVLFESAEQRTCKQNFTAALKTHL